MIRWSSSPLFVLQILHLAAQIVSLFLSVYEASFHLQEFYDETEYAETNKNAFVTSLLQYSFISYGNILIYVEAF